MIRWLRKAVARMVIGIGGFYTVIDPEMMEEVAAEVQKGMGNITYDGPMPEYEQLKKIEDEWVERGIIR